MENFDEIVVDATLKDGTPIKVAYNNLIEEKIVNNCYFIPVKGGILSTTPEGMEPESGIWRLDDDDVYRVRAVY